jgi:low affinity Fe/Cu permease
MAHHPVRSIITDIGTMTSRPWAFLILAAYVVLWIIFQPETLDWHGFATIATWAMTLFIQRAGHRDTQALQAKLDELLRATGEASNDLTKIDKKEPEEIEKHRSHEQATK